MQKIIIVEDDENIREAVQYALKASGFETAGYADAEGLYADLSGGGRAGASVSGGESGGKAALVILDVMLPGDDGLTILKRLRSATETSRLPIIMLTAKGSEFDRVKGLDLGADDYIVKPFSIMELISRVNAVLRRSEGASAEIVQEVLEYENLRLDHTKRLVAVDAINVELTFKEYELLRFMLANRGIALGRDRIIEAVWGYDFEGESRTLDMHVRSLRQKLGSAGRFITTIRNYGYRLGV